MHIICISSWKRSDIMTRGEELYIAGDLDGAWPVLQEEAKNGSGRAKYIIGQYYLQGHGHVQRNPIEGSMWFARGAKEDALACIGLHFFTKESGSEDESRFQLALSNAERKAATGDVLALDSLSHVYRLGVKSWVAVDRERGLSYLKKAADLGFWQAENDLGLIYLNGEELPKDESLGAALLGKAAAKGIAVSEYHMAYCYLTGIGVEKNVSKGIGHYQKSWKHGNTRAAVELGLRYETGNEVRQNEKKAYQLYKKAAEAGDGEAKGHAADCLWEGRGAKKDRKAAARLYQEGARAMDPYSLTRMGQIEFENKDYDNAYTYFLAAARRGFPVAQYLTGMCLLRGLGIEAKRDEAIQWLQQAARNGNREAAMALEQV